MRIPYIFVRRVVGMIMSGYVLENRLTKSMNRLVYEREKIKLWDELLYKKQRPTYWEIQNDCVKIGIEKIVSEQEFILCRNELLNYAKKIEGKILRLIEVG